MIAEKEPQKHELIGDAKRVPFEAYLGEKDATLTIEDRLLWEIRSSLEEGWDTISEEQQKELIEHFKVLINSARHYRETFQKEKFVSSPELENAPRNERSDLAAEIERSDAVRRAAHNAVVDALNIFSRRIKEFGLDNAWRGDDEIYALDEDGTRKKIAGWVSRLYRDEAE